MFVLYRTLCNCLEQCATLPPVKICNSIFDMFTTSPTLIKQKSSVLPFSGLNETFFGNKFLYHLLLNVITHVHAKFSHIRLHRYQNYRETRQTPAPLTQERSHHIRNWFRSIFKRQAWFS